MPRALSYVCPVCAWRGTTEPCEPTGDAACPNCGTLMYPQTWAETWGTALSFIGLALAVLALYAFLRSR